MLKQSTLSYSFLGNPSVRTTAFAGFGALLVALCVRWALQVRVIQDLSSETIRKSPIG